MSLLESRDRGPEVSQHYFESIERLLRQWPPLFFFLNAIRQVQICHCVRLGLRNIEGVNGRIEARLVLSEPPEMHVLVMSFI